MATTTVNRTPTVTILNAIVAALEALEWTPAGGAAEPAFQSVKLFDLNSLPDALQHLLVSQERCCIVVPDDERFTPRVQSQRRILLTRTLPVAIFLSDRILGDRQAALIGNATSPGAYGLVELVLPVLTGRLLAPPAGVNCVPTTCAVLNLQDGAQKLPGRSALELDVECTGGTIDAQLDPGTIL